MSLYYVKLILWIAIEIVLIYSNLLLFLSLNLEQSRKRGEVFYINIVRGNDKKHTLLNVHHVISNCQAGEGNVAGQSAVDHGSYRQRCSTRHCPWCAVYCTRAANTPNVCVFKLFLIIVIRK